MNALPYAHRIETTLTENGTLTLDHLPFQAGEAVEVIVLPQTLAPPLPNRSSLHGTLLAYQDPLEPVAEQEWEAIQ